MADAGWRRDFTIAAYEELLAALAARYTVIPVESFCTRTVPGRIAVLRHDVDRRIANAERCAEVAARLSVRGTFYFRYPYTFRPTTIKAVAAWGHEVGYHYEVVSKARGNLAKAGVLFASELAAFRRVCPVATACMHGAPLSRWDNRELWTVRSLAEYELVGEPYLSVDFQDVLYLTDTGRGWNHTRAVVRDRVRGAAAPRFDSTWQLAAGLRNGALPDRVMVTLHPERWDDGYAPWMCHLVSQRSKNMTKRLLIRWRRGAD